MGKFCQRFDGPCHHRVKVNKNKCFIVMSYSQKHSKVIEKMLKTALKKSGMIPILAKDIKHATGDMFCSTVCRPLMGSIICIIDMTYNNTSVGFEHGVAEHGLEKPCIITRYKLPRTGNLSQKEGKILEKLKNEGKIQFSVVPFSPPADFAGVHRIDYSSQKELDDAIKAFFKIRKIT